MGHLMVGDLDIGDLDIGAFGDLAFGDWGLGWINIDKNILCSNTIDESKRYQ